MVTHWLCYHRIKIDASLLDKGDPWGGFGSHTCCDANNRMAPFKCELASTWGEWPLKVQGLCVHVQGMHTESHTVRWSV